MKLTILTTIILFLSQLSKAQAISCTGITNDINASENVKFLVEIKKDKSPITKNFGPFYKSTIKYFYSTNTSFTGLDIAEHVSAKINKIIFNGSLSSSRNLTFNYNPDGTIQNVVMNYDDRIINQQLECEISGALPARPVCTEETDKTKSLIQAIKSSDIDSIETALECGANVNQVDKNGCTPLMFALDSACGELNPIRYTSPFAQTTKILDTLTSNGAFINTTDAQGETPLIKASKMNIPNVYDTFIALEADFDAQDKLGNTALMYAVLNGNDQVVEQLLEGNPDRRLKNINAKTAYDLAKQWQKESVIDLVRIADTSVLIQGKDDGTCSPLQINLKQGQVVDLTLQATDKMFKLESATLGLDIMADRKSTSKKTFALENKGSFKFTCGFHGANKPSEGVFIIQ